MAVNGTRDIHASDANNRHARHYVYYVDQMRICQTRSAFGQMRRLTKAPYIVNLRIRSKHKYWQYL